MPTFMASAVRLARPPGANVSHVARDFEIGDTRLRNGAARRRRGRTRGLNDETRLERRVLRQNEGIGPETTVQRPARRRCDNAPAETFFSTIKLEGVSPSYAIRDEAVAAIGQFIAQYNARRLHSRLGYRSPMRYAARHRRRAA